MSKHDDEITNLCAHFSKDIRKINAKSEVNQVFNTLDTVLKHHETFYQEILALGHIQDVQEAWVSQLATKTKTKLMAKII